MCLSPILLKNPNAGLSSVGVNYFRDTTSAYIEVPCGNCPQCIAMRQFFLLQRVQMESLRSHLFMLTLTYNNESLVFTDVGEYVIPIPFYEDVQKMFKRLRRQGHKFRYLICSEYGKKRFRPHYHALIAIEKSDIPVRLLEKRFHDLFFNEWKRNYASSDKRRNFKPKYRPLFTPQYDRMRCTTFDFHYVEPIKDHDNDVSFYVTKYITKYDKRTKSLLQKIKQDPSLSDDETKDLVSLIRPRSCMSKDFGDWKYGPIRDTINRYAARKTDYIYPQYFDIYTGMQMPMSPYYGKRIPAFADLYSHFENFSELADCNSFVTSSDNSVIDYHLERVDALAKWQKFEKNNKYLFDRCDF